MGDSEQGERHYGQRRWPAPASGTQSTCGGRASERGGLTHTDPHGYPSNPLQIKYPKPIARPTPHLIRLEQEGLSVVPNDAGGASNNGRVVPYSPSSFSSSHSSHSGRSSRPGRSFRLSGAHGAGEFVRGERLRIPRHDVAV